MKNSTSKSNVVSQVLFSAVAIVIAYLLLFNKNVAVGFLCQILCGGLVAIGVAAIVSYFVTKDYKRIDRYGFALGALLIMLGCIGFMRMTDLTNSFEIYTGLFSLLLGVLILQSTVQVKVLNYAVWVINLLLTIACLFGAFCVLADITLITQAVPGFSSWVLLISGVSSLLSLIITWICILLAGRREKKEKAKAETAAVTAEPVQPEAVPAASEPAYPEAAPVTAEPVQPEAAPVTAEPAQPEAAPAAAETGAPAQPAQPELVFGQEENKPAE